MLYDSLKTTTHKTLRGPRGGMIMMGKDFENPWGLKTPKGEIKMMSAVLNGAVFPGQQGGPLEHVIAAKAVSFGEALTDDYLKYIIQVKKNAEVMAKAFTEKGYKIVSGVGYGIGSAVINGATEYVFSTKYRHLDDALVLRPFPV